MVIKQPVATSEHRSSRSTALRYVENSSAASYSSLSMGASPQDQPGAELTAQHARPGIGIYFISVRLSFALIPVVARPASRHRPVEQDARPEWVCPTAARRH